MALMRLESDRYYQGKRNVEAYIDKFKDLIDLSVHRSYRDCTQIPQRVELDDPGSYR
jgi:hypothetical protein